MHVAESAPTVLFIGLDACDAGVMRDLAERGLCPAIARLIDAGAVVDTIAPYGTFVGSSWMTISTGAEVGSHRYWKWLEIDPTTYELRATTPRDSLRAPFWTHLSDAGRRVCVFDVPHADIPESLNGVLLKEWGCHDRHFGTASYPSTALSEVETVAGRRPYGSMIRPTGSDAFAPCDYALRSGPHRTLDEQRQLKGLLLEGVEKKQIASQWLVDQGPWDLLRRSITSVVAQTYSKWELVVVDDGSDTAVTVAAEFDDPRVTVVSASHGGPCAARNTGLRKASGQIVAYLDDDNTLDPGWLHAVSWAFANNPERDVVYGARLIDDRTRVLDTGAGGWPWVHFHAFDREHLRQQNFADMGVIAHRAEISGAVFDESLIECGDWDFFISVTQDQDPLELPAIAVLYRTDGADRLTGSSVADRDRVRQKWGRTTGLEQ